MRASKLLMVLSALFLSACAGSIEGIRYQETGADFDLFDFFNGPVMAYGIVQDRSGNVLQRFEVEIEGKVKNNSLILDETFSYSIGDGVVERSWTIDATSDPEAFTGSATDIPGPAKGRDFGNAFLWQYKMDLPVGDNSYSVKFEDWIWAFDNKRIINRSYIKKFGLTFAEVTIFMEKRSEASR